MPPVRRRRHIVSFWLVIIPVWAFSLAVSGLWLGLGIFWTVDSWQATHEGIEGAFIPREQACNTRGCQWYGDFVSNDGEHEVADVQFSSGLGDPQPKTTGVAVDPVVIAPGGEDVYNPRDKTWIFGLVFVVTAPLIAWVMIVRAHQLRRDWLREDDDPVGDREQAEAT